MSSSRPGVDVVGASELAQRCVEASHAVRRHEGRSLGRLMEVGELVELVLEELARMGGPVPASIQDRAADLLVAVSASGVPAVERDGLADDLAGLLADVADSLRGAVADKVSWHEEGPTAH